MDTISLLSLTAALVVWDDKRQKKKKTQNQNEEKITQKTFGNNNNKNHLIFPNLAKTPQNALSTRISSMAAWTITKQTEKKCQ